MKRLLLTLPLLAALITLSGAARAGVHFGAELATTSNGDPIVALVGAAEFTSNRDYRWFYGYELSITAIQGHRNLDPRDEMGESGGGDYRRDAFRYGWGWEDKGWVKRRFRIGTVFSLEQHNVDGHDYGNFEVGAFASAGLEWQRRYRAELVADTTQYFSLLATFMF